MRFCGRQRRSGIGKLLECFLAAACMQSYVWFETCPTRRAQCLSALKTVLQIAEASVAFALPLSAGVTLTLLLPSDGYTWMTGDNLSSELKKIKHNLWDWVGITAALKHRRHYIWNKNVLLFPPWIYSKISPCFLASVNMDSYTGPSFLMGPVPMVNASIQIYHWCFVFSTALWCDGCNSVLSKMALPTQAVISTAG